jgi:hypothetical protein
VAAADDQLPPHSCSSLRLSVIAGCQMRMLVAGCVVLAVVQPSFARSLLKKEPLALDPYAIVFVDDGSCSAGKVLKVTGSIRGRSRKKSCVLFEEERASLSRS